MTDKISQPASVQPEIYAPGYDSAFTQKLHVRRTAQQQGHWFLPYLQPGMSLLDCGCATGSITVGLAAAVTPGQVFGVDRSAAEIERARARAANAGVTNLRFDVGDIYQLEFPDNHVDAIFCHNVLEHVGDPVRALREMHRVLKVGGVIGVRDLDMGGILVAALDERLSASLRSLKPIMLGLAVILAWGASYAGWSQRRALPCWRRRPPMIISARRSSCNW